MITEEKLREVVKDVVVDEVNKVVNESEKRLSDKIGRLENEVMSGFGVVSTSFTQLEGRVNNLGNEVNGISSQVKTLSGEVKSLSGQVSGLSGEVKSLSGEVGELVGDMRTLGETVYNKIDKMAETVEKIDKNVGVLKQDLDLRSKAGNEGFNMTRDRNADAHKEFHDRLEKHNTRITTLERITGGA